MWHSLNEVTQSRYVSSLNVAPKGNNEPVSSPIYMSSNFHYPKDPSPEDLKNELSAQQMLQQIEDTCYYSRHKNPNVLEFERKLNALHGGSVTYCYPSGMGAISSVILPLIRPKATIVCSNEVYHDVFGLLQTLEVTSGIEVLLLDICDTQKVIEEASKSKTSMLYFESASNPNSKIPEIEEIVKAVNANNPDCLIIVDNTLLSPYLFRPFEWGIDIVIESATKYLSGKGDVLLGAAVFAPHKATWDSYRWKETKNQVHRWRINSGCCPSPFNCWLAAQGLDTLHLRMEWISNSTLKLCETLQSIPCVGRVVYAGLASHPNHALAKKYIPSQRFGGLFRFFIPSVSVSNSIKAETEKTEIACATSFGESHTLMMPGTSGSICCFKSDQMASSSGLWFRCAVGLQNTSELIKTFIKIFANVPELRCFLGSIKSVEFKKNIHSIKLVSSSKPNEDISYNFDLKTDVGPPLFTFVDGKIYLFDFDSSSKSALGRKKIILKNPPSIPIENFAKKPLYCFAPVYFLNMPK